MTHSAENDALPCCNVSEPDGIPCAGSMRRGWPEFVCGTCGARCGALAHPVHAIREQHRAQGCRLFDDKFAKCTCPIPPGQGHAETERDQEEQP